MNTLLNLLSAVAVVVSGTLAVTPPAPPVIQAPQAEVQMAPSLIAATKAQGAWLTLDDQGLTRGLDEQPMDASRRWIF